MKVGEKGEAQKAKKPTSPERWFTELIQNCLADLVNGKSNKGVTVEKLMEYSLATSDAVRAHFDDSDKDSFVTEIKSMVKNKQLAVGKGTTERGFKKTTVPYLKRIIRPYNPNRPGRRKKTE